MTYSLNITALIFFVCTGIDLTSFIMDGKTLDEKDILNTSGSWVEIPFLNSFRILVGKLFELLNLLLFIEDIIKSSSCTSVAAMNNDS